MNKLTDLIKWAKKVFPLPAVLAHYGLADRAKPSAKSPFRDGDNPHAFGIFQKENGDWNWKDFVTNEFGDEIDFIEKYEGRSKEDARTKYIELAGVKGSEPAPAKSTPISHKYEGPALPAPMPFDWETCVNDLTDEKAAVIADKRGYSKSYLLAMRGQRLIGLYKDKVAFPVIHDGIVTGCHARVSDIAWMFAPKGTKNSLYFIGNNAGAKNYFIFESQWDQGAVADRLGWHDGKIPEYCLIATRGASNGKMLAELEIDPKARIVVFPQNDPPRADGKPTPSAAWLDAVLEALKDHKVVVCETPGEYKDPNDWTRSGVESKALWDAILAAKSRNVIEALLMARKFNLDNPPQRTQPVIYLGNAGVAKPGDLVVVSAQVKSGKSAAIGAAISSLITSEPGDYLGFHGANDQKANILHFDTEQSPEDFHDLVVRSLRRAQLKETPFFLNSFCITDLTVDQRKQAIEFALKNHELPYAAVIIDGVADLCLDVNDQKETNELVDLLYRWAIQYRTPIICVLHENPNTPFGKTRGHLGSQLERKAATNLRLEKDTSGIVQIWSNKMRRGDIPQNSGPHFVWDDDVGMHVSCESSRSAKASAREDEKTKLIIGMAFDLFQKKEYLPWKELIDGIIAYTGKSKATAKRNFDIMVVKKVIIQCLTGEGYYLNKEFKR